MIPLAERRRLRLAIQEARACARDGRPFAGRDVLDLQLTWAEQPQFNLETLDREPAEPWAEELIRLSRRAFVAYCDRYD